MHARVDMNYCRIVLDVCIHDVAELEALAQLKTIYDLLDEELCIYDEYPEIMNISIEQEQPHQAYITNISKHLQLIHMVSDICPHPGNFDSPSTTVVWLALAMYSVKRVRTTHALILR